MKWCEGAGGRGKRNGVNSVKFAGCRVKKFEEGFAPVGYSASWRSGCGDNYWLRVILWEVVVAHLTLGAQDEGFY